MSPENWRNDERELVIACKKGNQSAFHFLYQLNSAWMYAICLRYMSNKEEAQDVLQDSFVLIYRKIDSFNFEGSFKGWMRKITVNCALSTFRKKTPQFISLADSAPSNEPIDIEFLQNLQLEELKKLINLLPRGRRQVFIAYVIDGFTHKEIAEMMDISEGTSKSQLFDAKKELKRAIENEYMIAKK
jgi:RNA polymerase sigma factor (sigma-70 family)